MKNLRNEARLLTLAIGLLVATSLALGAPAAAQAESNTGTIKIHDHEEERPEMRNVPHVSCDFYVEGFNMNAESGWLTFYGWPPTGDMSEVTPTGDDLNWTSDGVNEQGNHHFLKGPYFLPAGHYRVEAFADDGHPGDQGQFAKTKTFWVDPCEEEPTNPPCPEGLVAVAADGGAIELTWTGVDGSEQYNIYRAAGDEDFEYLATVNDTTFTDTDTVVGVTYSYYVTAYDGESESIGCMVVEVTAIPFFPTGILAAVALAGAVGAYVVFRRRS